MSEQFFFHRITDRPALADLGSPPLENPFYTDSYATAMQQLGYECWVIGLRAEGVLQDAAMALVRQGRMGATLEIPSLPRSARRTIFWDGVYEILKRLKITDLIARTFASPSFRVPALRGEIVRKKRIEFVLAIDNDDFATRLSSNHKRNINKARAAGVTVRHGSLQPEFLADHGRLIGHSRDRRVARGETIVATSFEVKEQRAYLESGAGELFQSVHKGQAVSSLLVLRSARTVYYQSTGTSAEGMRLGASHFLIHSVCHELNRQGVRTFNLGGAPEGSSLADFKAGFGATEVRLCECTSYVGPFWLKTLRTILQLAQVDRTRFRKFLSRSSRDAGARSSDKWNVSELRS